jgi:uncharacterized damage-inducible protein DinB
VESRVVDEEAVARLANTIPPDPNRVLVETYEVNERMNQILLEHLDPRVWQALPPGRRGRTIAAIFAHMHNIRRKWVRLSTPHLRLPAPLDRTRCTAKQAKAALRESAQRCSEMIESLLTSPNARKFVRDGWARPWPAGAAMVAYMISHDAHHRGQILMLAHQLGFSVAPQIGGGIWNWEKLWRDCGFTHPR